MIHNSAEILEQGGAVLDVVLQRYGFRRDKIVSGKTSSGFSATTSYLNGDRKLELYFRFSLGLVTYHFGSASITHDPLMKAVLGPQGGNRYPCFSDAPADSFRGLAHDLENFAQAFLTGDIPEFHKYVLVAEKQ